MTCPNIPMYCPLSVHSLAVQSSEAESNKAPLSRDMYSTLDTEPLCACQLASSGGLPSGLSSVEPALWVVDQTWRTNLWKGHISIVFPPLRCSSSCWWIKSNSKRQWNRLIKPKWFEKPVTLQIFISNTSLLCKNDQPTWATMASALEMQ